MAAPLLAAPREEEEVGEPAPDPVPDPEALEEPLGEVALGEDPEAVLVPLIGVAGVVPGFLTSNSWEEAKIWLLLVPLTKLTT